VAQRQKDDSDNEIWKELDVEEDDYEMVPLSEEDPTTQRDRFMATLQVRVLFWKCPSHINNAPLPAFPQLTHTNHLQGSKQDIRNQIGERLYHAITAIHGDLAGKLTGMFLEATESYSDLALLIFSEPSLRFHCQQAMQVLNAPQQACPTPSAASPEKAAQQKAQEPARSGIHRALQGMFLEFSQLPTWPLVPTSLHANRAATW
jgi:hypothetical protein